MEAIIAEDNAERIARHNKELAQTVVDAGAVPLLVLCFQEPEITLKRISASALSDICKHSPELAQTVVDAGAVALIAKDISHVDAPLKRQVCSCLSQIAKHSVDLAEVVVEAEIFPRWGILPEAIGYVGEAIKNERKEEKRTLERRKTRKKCVVCASGNVSPKSLGLRLHSDVCESGPYTSQNPALSEGRRRVRAEERGNVRARDRKTYAGFGQTHRQRRRCRGDGGRRSVLW